ncbi:hypothetical protein [Bacillus sp. Marseille-Q1617]|uniref:hypothetical protein n=1 Tax=Bacillus sp. Marseille-Q1617 TaxID=2736887 RepID=UPI00158F4B35|nr:hypothetical protein [Bacillus sp. Marseille-Q1617]
MIASMYIRRERRAYIVSAALLLAAGGFIAFTTPESAEQWLECLALLLPALMMLGIALASRSKYNKVKGADIPEAFADIVDLNHIVIKRDAGWMPRLLVFQKTGSFIGVFHIRKIPWWAYPFIIYQPSLLTFFPFELYFTSCKGEVLVSCRRKGFKQSMLEISGPEGQRVGSYIQEEFKSMVNITGVLKDLRGETLLDVKSSGFTGEFTLHDSKGRLWARFRYGRFPHTYTNIFRDVYNDMVEISDQLPENQKILLLGMVGYLFINRTSRD